jgi:hypothetical protein
MTRMMAHALDHVGELIRREPGKDFRRAVRFQLFKDRRAPAHEWIVKQLDHSSGRQHRHHGRGFNQSELIDQVSQIRGRQVADELTDPHTALIEPRVNPFQEFL